MIECDFFYDKEHNGYNARVREHPEIDASSGGRGAPLGSETHMREILAASWNAVFPGDLKTTADFNLNTTPPWSDTPEDIHTVRMPDKEEETPPV